MYVFMQIKSAVQDSDYTLLINKMNASNMICSYKTASTLAWLYKMVWADTLDNMIRALWHEYVLQRTKMNGNIL